MKSTDALPVKTKTSMIAWPRSIRAKAIQATLIPYSGAFRSMVPTKYRRATSNHKIQNMSMLRP